MPFNVITSAKMTEHFIRVFIQYIGL